MATREYAEKEKYNGEECRLVPPSDIFETPDEYSLKLEMPGVMRENLDITLDNDELMIRGRIGGEKEETMELKYSEYTLHDYERKFMVGNDIDRDSIHANLENGVLTLTLRKRESVKPKKIEISTH